MLVRGKAPARFLGDRCGTIHEPGGGIAEHLVPGVLVWASNSTTAVLDAAMRGLAVMVMRPVGDFDLCPMQDVSVPCPLEAMAGV